MKVIFLDIDGVLNNELWFKANFTENQKIDSTDEFRLSMIDDRCVELLNLLIDKTMAKVVISSSWRHRSSVNEIKCLLQKKGFRYDILDFTPVLYFKTNIKYSYSVPRGCEIKAWLEINKGILGDKITKVKYAILDDDSDMLYWQRNNYFRVDSYTGLTPNLIYRVIQFLNNED